MPSASPRLSLPFIQPAQAQKHVTHNEAIQRLDAVVQLLVRSFGATTPPADPVLGDVHDVGAGAAGAWTGQSGRLALWDGTGWQFIDPGQGWLAWDAAATTLRVHDGGVWTPVAPALQDLPGLGIGTTSDEVNRLAIAADATLLSHDGQGHQLKVNKAAPADTASLLFQSNWTGHAEMGLAGDLDFAVKVSDGTTWRTALRAANATGVVALPHGAHVDGPVTGAAVQSSPTDATPGRLLLAGAFGLGGPLPAIAAAAALDGSIAPGLHAYDTAQGSTDGPAGVTRGTLLHARRGVGASGETQLLLVEAGSTPGLYPGLVLGRARSGGGWSGWTCGSVQDSAATAQGRVLRHQDGTQTCWHSLTTSASAETVWTFPQAFASVSGLVVTMGVGGGSGALFPRHSAKGTGSASLSVLDTSGARVAATLDVMAVGRWY